VGVLARASLKYTAFDGGYLIANIQGVTRQLSIRITNGDTVMLNIIGKEVFISGAGFLYADGVHGGTSFTLMHYYVN
jgi:hypothetical protein